jgi:type I restriction enzyme R subunit
MSNIAQIERHTQTSIVKLFQEKMGYSYLGNWEERECKTISKKFFFS